MPHSYIENEKTIRQLKISDAAGKIPLPNFDLLKISGPFQSVNEFFETSFFNFGELLNMTSTTPDSCVLDYGCGLGRLAIPFSLYLRNGHYVGIDANLTSLEHCKKSFAENDKLKFMHFDLYSKMYNQAGKGFSMLGSTELEMKFDICFLFSVFTHVLPENTNELLEFIFKVLKPGGEMLATFFLLNEHSLAEIMAGRATRKFPFEYGEARIDNKNVPEGAVAYFQDDVLKRLTNTGFSDPFVIPGGWSRAPQQFHMPHQDIIICRKLSS
jgi:SAM-dependent methyltransferase